MPSTPNSNLLLVNNYPGRWGFSSDRGLWAQVSTPHGGLTAGDDGTHLATFAALASTLDCHDLIYELGLTFACATESPGDLTAQSTPAAINWSRRRCSLRPSGNAQLDSRATVG